MDWSLFMDTQLGMGECDLFCWMELCFRHTQTNTHTHKHTHTHTNTNTNTQTHINTHYSCFNALHFSALMATSVTFKEITVCYIIYWHTSTYTHTHTHAQ